MAERPQDRPNRVGAPLALGRRASLSSPMNPLLRAALVLATSVITLTLQASCARSVTSEGDSDPLLVSPSAQNPTPLTSCIATQCPLPWATCPNGVGLCTTDTSRDVDHCGSCDNACPHQPPSHHATSVCSDGKCAIACDALSADCNHIAADGCEIYTGDDPLNCGACGHACKAGEILLEGRLRLPERLRRVRDRVQEPRGRQRELRGL